MLPSTGKCQTASAPSCEQPPKKWEPQRLLPSMPARRGVSQYVRRILGASVLSERSTFEMSYRAADISDYRPHSGCIGLRIVHEVQYRDETIS
jgi:hypothetical protein